MLYVIILLVIALIAAGTLRNIVYGRIDRRTVPELDLDRYMGVWYEIARFDNRFEKGLCAVTARYTLLGDGRVEVVNSGLNPRTGRKKTSIGRAKKTSHPGRLRVSFWGPFYSDYNVLELDKDYNWALVGSSSHRYLWILSRTPTLPEDTVVDICLKAEERGYRTEELRFIDQSRHMGN